MVCFASPYAFGNESAGSNATKPQKKAPLASEKAVASLEQIRCLSELVDGFVHLSRSSRPSQAVIDARGEWNIFDSGRAMLSIAGALAQIPSRIPHHLNPLYRAG